MADLIRSCKALGTIIVSLLMGGLPSGFANTLTSERSPYLLQHATDPVQWYPWGDEAFARAKRENKPIFLSVGYSTCHWCHVMADESFRDPRTAEFLNQHFINVKVDREERPDVDRLYMEYLQALTGRGGWPMNVWLSPEGEPFFAGTYFPPRPDHGLPAFSEVAKRMADGWATEEAEIRAHGAKALSAIDQVSYKAGPSAPVQEEGIGKALKSLKQDFDPEWGGFGREAKFPSAAEIRFLFRSQDKEARDMGLATLRSMAAGALRDHVSGGFHRYTADRQWRVPHFEKMLIDQAQISLAFLEAYQLTRDPLYASIARETLDFVLAEMSHPDGGFWAALPAQSKRSVTADKESEGGAYLWKYEELKELLSPEEFHTVLSIFAVEEQGNVAAEFDALGELTGENVLFLRASEQDAIDPALWESARRKLQSARSQRPALAADDKIVTMANGLMLSALAQGGVVLGDPRYQDAARKTAAFFRNLAGAKGVDLPRFWRGGEASGSAFAEDYAGLIGGLLDLYEAGGNFSDLEWALQLQARQDALFWDDQGKGYFSTRAVGGNLPVRLKEWRDGAEPSANILSLQNLLRISRMLDDARGKSQAVELLTLFTPRSVASPRSFPNLWSAQLLASSPSQQAVLAGSIDDRHLHALRSEIRSGFRPSLAILYSDGGSGQEFLGTKSPAFLAMLPIKGQPALYFCENFTCKAPVVGPDGVKELFRN